MANIKKLFIIYNMNAIDKLTQVDKEFAQSVGELADVFSKFSRSKDLEPQVHFKRLVDSLKEKNDLNSSFNMSAFAAAFSEFFPKYLKAFRDNISERQDQNYTVDLNYNFIVKDSTGGNVMNISSTRTAHYPHDKRDYLNSFQKDLLTLIMNYMASEERELNDKKVGDKINELHSIDLRFKKSTQSLAAALSSFTPYETDEPFFPREAC